MRYVIALAALLLAGNAMGQTCPAAPADPVPWNAARLVWPAVTQWDDGTVIPLPNGIRYKVYEIVNDMPVHRCTTAATTAGQLDLTVGDHEWFVVALTPISSPEWVESAPSPIWSKTIAAPVVVPTRRVPAGPTALDGF